MRNWLRAAKERAGHFHDFPESGGKVPDSPAGIGIFGGFNRVIHLPARLFFIARFQSLAGDITRKIQLGEGKLLDHLIAFVVQARAQQQARAQFGAKLLHVAHRVFRFKHHPLTIESGDPFNWPQAHAIIFRDRFCVARNQGWKKSPGGTAIDAYCFGVWLIAGQFLIAANNFGKRAIE